ncbi:MAG: hypothetical protein JWO72_2596 [Caulobacteraceae bacterium]|jgi:hypothetical protein|nr:hypothetical protein [Caulobacteraceae bacterium]
MALVRGASVALLAIGLFSLGACGHRSNGPEAYSAGGGGGFLGLGRKPLAPPVAGIGVNAYLWRASLDTLAFMPLASADPYGGVIITDWYTNPEKPDERFKATVYILDTRLRADGLTVTVFKQVKGADGNWAESSSSNQTQVDIENSILTRARQLRLSNIR